MAAAMHERGSNTANTANAHDDKADMMVQFEPAGRDTNGRRGDEDFLLEMPRVVHAAPPDIFRLPLHMNL